jgi:hypothetical protein
MQAMYVGDEAETTVFGLTFTRGEPVDVSGLSEAFRAKLAGNGQFETSKPAPRGRIKLAEPAGE